MIKYDTFEVYMMLLKKGKYNLKPHMDTITTLN